MRLSTCLNVYLEIIISRFILKLAIHIHFSINFISADLIYPQFLLITQMVPRRNELNTFNTMLIAWVLKYNVITSIKILPNYYNIENVLLFVFTCLTQIRDSYFSIIKKRQLLDRIPNQHMLDLHIKPYRTRRNPCRGISLHYSKIKDKTKSREHHYLRWKRCLLYGGWSQFSYSLSWYVLQLKRSSTCKLCPPDRSQGFSIDA